MPKQKKSAVINEEMPAPDAKNDSTKDMEEKIYNEVKKSGTAKTTKKKTSTGKKHTKDSSTSEEKPAPAPKEKTPPRIFALDIGTRSGIGIVAETDEHGDLKILATERQEHKTRAMLDGQIHDVPQVAAVIEEVKEKLVAETGEIKSAAVAAAGRALYTMTAESELTVNGIISADQQRSLDFAGVQSAQAKLATSHTIDDPTRYYCVGYSTIRYILDDIPLKSLVGQRGKVAKAQVIATFLPRQVIDSMQSALAATNLEMRALTLEPIAAINVLIPPTMRHLNLVLVDIGAGTSDVAITKNGSVIAYGMVPQAGDEITEAISQQFLLDFNVAENIKRLASGGEGAKFTDILGTSYDLTAEEIIRPIVPNIQGLAKAISSQILELNGEAPQAVMLVGGGSLTPLLQKFVADELQLPGSRVAVRKPEAVDGVADIPELLRSPDAVTPLGILKIASINTLHFLSVYVNDEEYSLFNFRELTVSDALLNAGINLKKFNGHPGLGLMVTVQGKKKFFPGSLGTLAEITMDGEHANLETPIKNDSRISIVPGKNGATPKLTLADVVEKYNAFSIYVNGEEKKIYQQITLNGENAAPDTEVKDGDTIESREPKTIGEALKSAGFPPTGRRIKYELNGSISYYTCHPDILVNDAQATLSMPINEGDRIEYQGNDAPKLGDVLGITSREASLSIYYNKEEHRIPTANIELNMNGRPANVNTILEDDAQVRFLKSERTATTVSDALLAVNFQPPAATSRMKFTLLVNDRPAEFTDPIKNGDSLEVILTPIETKPAPKPAPKPTTQILSHADIIAMAQSSAPEETAPTIEPTIASNTNINSNLNTSDLTERKNPTILTGRAVGIPGLAEAISAGNSEETKTEPVIAEPTANSATESENVTPIVQTQPEPTPEPEQTQAIETEPTAVVEPVVTDTDAPVSAATITTATDSTPTSSTLAAPTPTTAPTPAGSMTPLEESLLKSLAAEKEAEAVPTAEPAEPKSEKWQTPTAEPPKFPEAPKISPFKAFTTHRTFLKDVPVANDTNSEPPKKSISDFIKRN